MPLDPRLAMMFRPTTELQDPQDGMLRALRARGMMQGNRLADMQMQAYQTAQAEQARRRNALQQFTDAIPSPQAQAVGAATMDGRGPTLENAARMRPVDPRIQALYKGVEAGAVDPVEFLKTAYPTPKDPEYKVVGGSLVKIGPAGVSEAYRAPEQTKPDAFDAQLRGVGIDPDSPEGLAYKRARLKKQTEQPPAPSATVVMAAGSSGSAASACAA